VCSTGRSWASSKAGASKACWLTTSTSLATTASKMASKAAVTPGVRGGGGPPGITRASAASRGSGTVIISTPETSEPWAQNSRTAWPRRARPTAKSVSIACAPPACVGRSGVTGEAMTAILTS
jgi:hypothetical protein